MNHNCLYCYKPLESEQIDFHLSCSKKIFETPTPPLLPYRKEQIADLAMEIIRSRTALTGVQSKLSLDIHKESSLAPRFTIVGLWGRYILKPQAEKFAHLPEVEDVTMHLAEIAKISIVPHSLIRFEDGSLCYITRRIDRDEKGNKLHMEDMCQLTERLTEDKYRGSYEQIAKAILKYSAKPGLDVVNFFEQLLFCYLTGNADMHLKNFSLIKSISGTYCLSPGYDMLSTALVMPEDKEELALTLNAKKKRIKKHDFEAAMSSSGMTSKAIDNVFKKFIKVIPFWLTFIDQSFLPVAMQRTYKNIVTEKARIL
ncbi:MAG: HipA domain-containing protein [Bacteroidales bacterium]|nr:HipA domain-containing protein [Bacteroidales bacterium]MCL2132909.1 HipA domain-containing protein [Bacteroidales bacterium]